MFRRWLATPISVVLLLVLSSARTVAIADGQEDTANIYANVAAIEYNDGGDWYAGCTATLIGLEVMLTAAHCVFDVTPADIRVNFNNVLARPADPQDSLAYSVEAIAVHPDFTFGGHGVNSITALETPFEDIALLWLANDVAGIVPASLPTAGYLDNLDLSVETFVAVGYGWEGLTTGSFASRGAFGFTRHSYRSYREVSGLGYGPYPDRIVLTGSANCPGDSGGPLFHGNTVVAVHDWSLGLRCESTSGHYRVDSAIAQDFLADNL